MDILLIEDNRLISEFMIKGLQESGFFVTLADTGIEGRSLIVSRQWDLILLDIMLPDIDGFELLQYTRFKKIKTPIIVVSALNSSDDKVKALNIGADDYLSKPFHFKELIARIYALTRRIKMNYEEIPDMLECRDIKLYPDQHKVERSGTEIHLTMQEFKLLKLMMEHKNNVLTRSQILDSVWGINYDSNTNLVDVYISYLRNKIEKDNMPKLIKTIKGRGYMIKEEE